MSYGASEAEWRDGVSGLEQRGCRSGTREAIGIYSRWSGLVLWASYRLHNRLFIYAAVRRLIYYDELPQL